MLLTHNQHATAEVSFANPLKTAQVMLPLSPSQSLVWIHWKLKAVHAGSESLSCFPWTYRGLKEK